GEAGEITRRERSTMIVAGDRVRTVIADEHQGDFVEHSRAAWNGKRYTLLRVSDGLNADNEGYVMLHPRITELYPLIDPISASGLKASPTVNGVPKNINDVVGF